jgi:hypothetical protein
MKHRAGFTIIETLIVVGITVILSSILIVNSRSNKEQIAFFRSQSVLANSFLRAKAFSVETFQPAFQPCPGCAIDVSPTERVCGWGIFFDKPAGKYILFRDLAPGGGASQCASANGKYSPGEEFEIFTPDAGVVLDSICFVPSGTCTNRANITFIPPDPSVDFYDDGGKNTTDAQASVTLKIQSTGFSRTIHINRAGQVVVK